MAKLDWRTRLNRKWRERVFLAATREFGKSKASSVGIGAVVALTVAVLVFALSAMFLAAGLYLIMFDFPNLVAALIGLVLLAIALLAFPRVRTQGEGYPRGSFPSLEATLDSLSEEVGAPKISTITLTSDWNAGVRQSVLGRNSHITLGLPFLYAAQGCARSAILAHELAHLVNGDPQRGALVSRAGQTLDGWLRTLGFGPADPYGSGIAGAGEAVRQVLAFVLIGLRSVMERSTFFASQKAEYVADGFSAKVAGSAAMRSALLLSAITDDLDRELQSFIPKTERRGRETLEFLREHVRGKESADHDLRAQLSRSLSRTDRSHPPTAYRLAFLETLGEKGRPAVVDDETWSKIWRALEPHLEAAGAEVLSRRELQAPIH